MGLKATFAFLGDNRHSVVTNGVRRGRCARHALGMTNLDARITSLAAPTGGAIHATTLRDAGIGRSRIAERIRDGRMKRELARTYVVGPDAQHPTNEMLAWAGVLHGGPGSLVSHETALERHGVWDRGSDAIHVTAPRSRRPCRHARIRFHAHDGALTPSTDIAGAPTVRVLDALLQAARSHTAHQVAYMIARAIYRQLASLEDVFAITSTLRHVPGIATLRSAATLVAVGSAGTRSRTEDRLHAALGVAGIPPDEVNVRGCMGIVSDEPDFVWHGVRLNVEVDGGHHERTAQAATDRARDLEARSHGWRVHRVRAIRVWKELPAVVREVGALIRNANTNRQAARRRALA